MKRIITILISCLLLASCKDASELYPPTTIKITDPVRHYYPVVQGESFDIYIPIKNTGEKFLKITDIQTSCGCMNVDESSFKLIKSGEVGMIKITNDSRKNIGYVKHYVKIYANIPNGETEVVFDYNVVPDALYTPDYEELYSKDNPSDSESRHRRYKTPPAE